MSITGRRNLKALLYVEIVQLFMDEMYEKFCHSAFRAITTA